MCSPQKWAKTRLALWTALPHDKFTLLHIKQTIFFYKNIFTSYEQYLFAFLFSEKRKKTRTDHRGGSRTAATSKMELFVIIVNGFQPLTMITKSSMLDVATVLDPPLDQYTLKCFTLSEKKQLNDHELAFLNRVLTIWDIRWPITTTTITKETLLIMKISQIKSIAHI